VLDALDGALLRCLEEDCSDSDLRLQRGGQQLARREGDVVARWPLSSKA
jgi:hypothetical protein